MSPLSLRIVALSAVLALAGCGGGDSQDSGAAVPPAPAPGPSPSPAPSPSPSPSPGPSPSPSPSPAPAPAPATPPSPEVMRGAVIYQSNCASCHGLEPETGTQGIYKGVSVSVLQAAYRRVQVMNLFSASLSAANTSDLAAYISSRVSP